MKRGGQEPGKMLMPIITLRMGQHSYVVMLIIIPLAAEPLVILPIKLIN
jgi:hypothetical protein